MWHDALRSAFCFWVWVACRGKTGLCGRFSAVLALLRAPNRIVRAMALGFWGPFWIYFDCSGSNKACEMFSSGMYCAEPSEVDNGGGMFGGLELETPNIPPPLSTSEGSAQYIPLLNISQALLLPEQSK